MADIKMLIKAIQERPVLWDKRNKLYHNRELSHREWEAVAKIVHSTTEIVKKKWKNLRDSFFREFKKNPKPRSGADDDNQPTYIGTWPFFDLMSFLNLVVNPRKQKRNMLSTFFASGDSDSMDASEATTTSSVIPEKQLEEALAQNISVEETQNNDNAMSLPSTSREADATVEINSVNFQKASLRNRKRKEVAPDCFATKERKNQLLPKDQIDEDFQWLKFILPYIKQLPPIHRLRFRTLMQQLLLTEISKLDTLQTPDSENDYNEQF